MTKDDRRAIKVEAALKEIGEVLYQKFKEEGTFTGTIDFQVHCHHGGIGNVDAYSRQEIKSGASKNKI